MKVLITGVAGLLGSRLSDWILDNKTECEVYGIDDLSGGYIENVNPRVKFIRLNLSNSNTELTSVFDQIKPDYVFHFAAYAAEGLSPFIRTYNYDNNLRSTAAIINECIRHNVKRLVFTSTLAVYGHGYGGVFDESQIPNPIDPYGVAKYACEMDIQIAGEQHGLEWCIIRPHNVYGEYQNLGDRYRNVVGIFMNQLMQGKPLTIFGDGSQSRAFSYVGDIAPLIASCINNTVAYNQVINIGTDQHFTVKELAYEVMNAMDLKGDLIFTEARNEVVHAWSDHSKCNQIFGTKPHTPLPVGLRKMATWAQQTGIKHSKKFDDIEITLKLPRTWR